MVKTITGARQDTRIVWVTDSTGSGYSRLSSWITPYGSFEKGMLRIFTIGGSLVIL